MSCTKTAETIEMQFGMLTRGHLAGSREHVLHGDAGAPWNGHFLWVSDDWNALYSIRFWVSGKRESCAKMSVPILTIYTLYDVFLHAKFPFVGHNDCTGIKIFSGNQFFWSWL